MLIIVNLLHGGKNAVDKVDTKYRGMSINIKCTVIIVTWAIFSQ